MWFGPTKRPLAGWFHAPPSGRARAGVVICPPFAHEYDQAHFALRLVAEGLAERGLCVLRFDYDGTGDSAGSGEDPGRLDAWLRSIAEAMALIRGTGVEEVSLVGMRIGATLAARAAVTDGRVDQLVLWDPCLSGRGFLREQQATSMITLGTSGTRPDGSVETPGLTYRPEVVRELRGLRLDTRPGPAARRVLVLTRPDRESAQEVVAALGSELVEHGPANGQAALMDVGPPFQKLPTESIERVATWVAQGAGDSEIPLRVPRPAGPVTVGHDAQGRPIIERPFFVGAASLFGILTETPACSPEGPVALFLSVANEHHIGTGRLWVDLARRWAGLGVRGLRLDMSGLGESGLRHRDQERFVTRAPESFEDVADAVAAVAPGHPERVILVGLCSSAYQVIDSGLQLQPGGIVVINPVLAFVPAEVERGLPVDPRRQCALPKKPVAMALQDPGAFPALRRQFPGLRRRLRQLAQPSHHSGVWLQALMASAWRIRLSLHRRRRPRAWLQTLVESGVDVLLVAGERETRPVRFSTSARFRSRLADTGRFHFEYLPDLEHSLLVQADRDRVVDLVTEHVVARFVSSSPNIAETATPLASSA